MKNFPDLNILLILCNKRAIYIDALTEGVDKLVFKENAMAR